MVKKMKIKILNNSGMNLYKIERYVLFITIIYVFFCFLSQDINKPT